MSEKLEPEVIEEKIFKTDKGLQKETFVPAPPDYICNEQNAVCAWIDHRNTEGEIISLNIHVGELRFKLRKRWF